MSLLEDLVERTMAQAIRSAVLRAESAAGVPSLREVREGEDT